MTENKDNEVISSSAQGKWVGHWWNPIAGERELILPERFAVLVVLNGEIDLVFNKYTHRTISKQSLVIIDRQQLTSFKWKAATSILEFTPPKKIFQFFISCGSVFKVPCSTIIPVLGKLQEWVNNLMTERLKPASELDEICQRNYCVRLMNILNDYPPLLVGEILVAFQACAMSGEKKCNEDACVI